MLKLEYYVILFCMCFVASSVYAYNVTTQANACTTPMQASQMLIVGWQMHNRTVANTCANPMVVNTLFITKAAPQPNATWRLQGCQSAGISRATCLYTFEGGAAQLNLLQQGLAARWYVLEIRFIAD